MEKSYGTIVRDNTVELIKKSPNVINVEYRSAENSTELNMLIADKLVKTAKDLRDRVAKSGELDINDIVNVQEILDKIKHEAPYTMADYAIAQEKKAVHNGRYDLNMILDKVVGAE